MGCIAYHKNDMIAVYSYDSIRLQVVILPNANRP